jgi:hypothetical protein
MTQYSHGSPTANNQTPAHGTAIHRHARTRDMEIEWAHRHCTQSLERGPIQVSEVRVLHCLAGGDALSGVIRQHFLRARDVVRDTGRGGEGSKEQREHQSRKIRGAVQLKRPTTTPPHPLVNRGG